MNDQAQPSWFARPNQHTGPDYREDASSRILDMFHAINEEMRGQPAHMVYEMLDAHRNRHLPDVDVDEDTMRGVAAEISFGLLTT